MSVYRTIGPLVLVRLMSVDHDFEKSCMSVHSCCVFHRVSCNIAFARPKFHSDHLLFSHTELVYYFTLGFMRF